MGYSIFVIARNPKLQAQALEFLKNEVTPWHKLIGLPSHQQAGTHYLDMPVCGNDIAYGAIPAAIGYNFSTQGDAGQYLWCLLRFLALRIGSTRTIDGVKTKFVCYDGFDLYPTHDCDDNGYRKIKGNSTEEQLYRQHDSVIANEMKRLGEFWPLPKKL